MYPKLTTVEKGVLSRAWEGGVGIFRTLFNVQSETATEDGFTPPSTETMVKQCLRHYLEPFKWVLLDKHEDTADFKLDEFVKQVTQVFNQHNKPVVQHQRFDCATVTVDIKDVKKECNGVTLLL